MNRLSQRALATLAAIGVLMTPIAAQTQRKLISPQRGEANIEITKPDTKLVASEVVTVIMVKNVSPAPIAGFKVEENWYDKAGTPVGGGIYRHTKPLMPEEVIRIELKTPRRTSMNSNKYDFTHSNGSVKPKVVPKLVVAPPTS